MFSLDFSWFRQLISQFEVEVSFILRRFIARVCTCEADFDSALDSVEFDRLAFLRLDTGQTISSLSSSISLESESFWIMQTYSPEHSESLSCIGDSIVDDTSFRNISICGLIVNI